MGLIALADLNTLMDYYIDAERKLYGTLGNDGMHAGYTNLDTAMTTLGATGNIDAITDLGRQLGALRDTMNALVRYGIDSRPFLAALDRHAKRFGGANFSSLNTMLTYYNTVDATKWQVLQHPVFRDIYNAVKGSPNAPVYPSPWNLWYQIAQGAAAPNAMYKLVFAAAGGGSVNTDGAAVPYTQYAGGYPYLKVAPGGGAVGIENFVVTGRAFDPVAKGTVNGVTWTGTANGAGPDVALVPGTAPANSLIVDVSGVAHAVTGANDPIGNSTIYVEARPPAGRVQ